MSAGPAGGSDGDAALLALGRRVLDEEAAGVRALAAELPPGFALAARWFAACAGRLVVTGMGKAGLIGRKVSATFASTGTPSLFVHPADALHGDLGAITTDDVVLALSHSGETEELVRLIGPLRRAGARLVAICASVDSTLGQRADLVLPMGRHAEAGGHGLAPTTSTTVMLALGDALAMATLELRGFTLEEFARVHPAGALGRRLMRVDEVMRTGERLPLAASTASVGEVIGVMTRTPGRPGASLIVDPDGRLIGMFTDGDLRRLLESGGFDPHTSIPSVMSGRPKTIAPDLIVEHAARLLSEHHVDQVPVVDAEGRPVGLLDVQDVLAARVL